MCIRDRYSHPSRIASKESIYDNLPIVVEIRDSGGGIPKAMLDSIFNPFVTTKDTGSGLGLSVASKIINDHGGRIEFASKPGQTICFVKFPAIQKTKKSRAT